MNIVDILGFQPTIYLDDGHGINTPGKRTPFISKLGRSIKENEFNKSVVKILSKELEELGFRVAEVAPEEEDVKLSERVSRSNNDFEDMRRKYKDVEKHLVGLFISIHYNALNGVFGTNKGGIETYYDKYSSYGKKLAGLIQKELINGTPQINRGIKDNKLYVTRYTHMVANLIELGFMDVLDEALLMIDKDFQIECAKEIVSGILNYYEIDANFIKENNLKDRLKQIHELSRI